MLEFMFVYFQLSWTFENLLCNRRHYHVHHSARALALCSF
jgi:hypothetical protein